MARENMSSEADPSKSSPVPFLFEGQHLVRAIVDAEGEPWFVGVDVCRILGLANSNHALARLDEDERSTIVIDDGAQGGPARITVSEAGVYRLIFTSRKEAAERFKRWLAHDVLPSIRRTGRYEHWRGATARINTAALNAASRAVGEVRRSLGARVAAEALPDIFAKAGVNIPARKPDQGELDLSESPNVVNLRQETRRGE
jgi:prophage antirepressor-like protein